MRNLQLLLGLGLALAAATAEAATRTVVLRDIEIRPATVRIAAGDTVRWQFRDPQAGHNVTSRGRPRFRSSPSKTSGSYRFRFTRPGTYRYVCTIHPSMRGKVVVG